MIVWDKRTTCLVLICLVMLILASAFKLNGSSIDNWNKLLGNPKQTNVILGQARAVRVDEWMVVTPGIVSQARHLPAFPVRNENIGAVSIPLLFNLPVRHFSALFRPQYWGFFFLGLESAFSLYWNLKSAALFLSFFFLLLLLSGNKFWLALCGALWLLYSSFTQWWFSAPAGLPEMFASGCLAAIAILYLFFARRLAALLIAGLIGVVASLNFLLSAYPPFQIPLFYLMAAMVIGFCYDQGEGKAFRRFGAIRIIILLLTLLGIGSITLLLFSQLRPTLAIIQNTVYPGARLCSGGGMGIEEMLSGFYNIFLTEEGLPKGWPNICEAANFIILSPLLLLPFFFHWRVWLKKERLMVVLLIFQCLLSLWIVAGFPVSISRVTLFSMVTEERALIALGAANIISVILFFSRPQYRMRWGLPQAVIFTVIFFCAGIAHGFWLNYRSAGFFHAYQIILASVLFAGLGYTLLRQHKIPFFIIIGILLFPNLSVNPLAKGLAPLMEQDVSRFIAQLDTHARASRWVVFGDCRIANFLKSTGLAVFNGTKAAPELARMSVLDPAGAYQNVYNRYAAISCAANKEQDKISFSLQHNDFYTINIHPCNRKLARLGINYLVFTYRPSLDEVDCLEPLTEEPVSGLYIYRRSTQ